MYRTRELNKNIAKSYLSVGDPYRDPHIIEGKSDRHKSKQFQTVPPKDTSDGGGYFDKKTYSSDPLQDGVAYLKTQPAADRKAGFGTKDASRRDEFMSHVRTEQYRETLAREEHISQKGIQGHPDEDDGGEHGEGEGDKHQFPEGLKETKFLYDIGRTQATEFNQKSHRDTFYTLRTGNSQFRRNNGHFVLSSESVGVGAHKVQNNGTHARNACTKQFYDHSHLHS
ncbi:hypothetical protein H257_10131 [Aphanomyces astaci]|uniref:Uncharacterized protein n=2 Tax=Aphanomyces astaci TaxID=112090 RepID=W4G9X8_APHAT|nr:hypothetical protein H257_10131 [Aphanomyces astaci]ETV75758.1 hypothetical protein H257_10131 [Aphanomyces astaci]RHY12381.1 hypothetical protein DYB25_006546 [Aphanomyces astaci]RHY75935.1 hypothetical protein DYB30_013441 [Aphanomyces astaci]RHZ14229.1 hypothetical protein DYB31_008884 [Aphanomyces astaci]RLN91578.1 hypothetical protein DYB28_010624 [Aphanomyces astaci]|eukprot:XP_009834889.1 hypothetical protein H257_10131 [Aphanomyces astaci]